MPVLTLTPALKQSLRLSLPNGFMRSLVSEDVHAGYVAGLNDLEVNRYMVAVREKKQTFETVRAFVQADDVAPNAVLFGIWANDSPVHCGTVRLHSIDFSQRTAALGICIFDKSVWGSGLGSAVIGTVTRWALNTLALDSIYAGTYMENVSSWKAFMKAGYVLAEDIHDRYQRDGKPAVVRQLVAHRTA